MIHTILAVYSRTLTDAESRYLQAHTSHAIRSLSAFGLETCIILSLIILMLAAVKWRRAKPIKRPTYKKVLLLAKIQSVLFFLSILVDWLAFSWFYYRDRAGVWPFALSLLVLAGLFVVSVVAIMTLRSMHENDGPLQLRKMWHGRKAISTTVTAFLFSSGMAALMFFVGIS